MLPDHLLETKKEFKNLKKQGIQDISMGSYIKLAFKMIWFMEILKIYQEEKLYIKYWVIKFEYC